MHTNVWWVSQYVGTISRQNIFWSEGRCRTTDWEEWRIVPLGGGEVVIYHEELHTWLKDGRGFSWQRGYQRMTLATGKNWEGYWGLFIAPSKKRDVLKQRVQKIYSHEWMHHIKYTMTRRVRLGVWCPWVWLLLTVDWVRKSWTQRDQYNWN